MREDDGLAHRHGLERHRDPAQHRTSQGDDHNGRLGIKITEVGVRLPRSHLDEVGQRKGRFAVSLASRVVPRRVRRDLQGNAQGARRFDERVVVAIDGASGADLRLLRNALIRLEERGVDAGANDDDA